MPVCLCRFDRQVLYKQLYATCASVFDISHVRKSMLTFLSRNTTRRPSVSKRSSPLVIRVTSRVLSHGTAAAARLPPARRSSPHRVPTAMSGHPNILHWLLRCNHRARQGDAVICSLIPCTPAGRRYQAREYNFVSNRYTHDRGFIVRLIYCRGT